MLIRFCGRLSKGKEGQNMKMTGAQILMKMLKEEGVDTIFGYPGVYSLTFTMNLPEPTSGIFWFAMNKARLMPQTAMPAPAVKSGFVW